MKLILAWISVLAAVTGLQGSELSLIGTHPTSTLTPYPSIFALKAHAGRIYMGYGDWNVYPVAVVASYDPGSNAFRLEYSAPTDSLDNYQTVGNRLFAPSIDPIHYEGFQDYSVREGNRWRSFTPGGLLHAFEIDTVNGTDLWMVGSKTFSETPSSGGVVMRSLDGGRSWSDITPVTPPARYYYGFALRGRYYVHGTVFDGSVSSPASSLHGYLNRATAIGSGTNEFVIGLAGRLPGFSDVTAQSLASFDGDTWRTLQSNVVNFTVSEGILYALITNQIIRASSLTATQVVWQTLPLSSITNACSIEVLDDVVYVGNTAGELWTGRTDGMPLQISTPAIINEMPDAYGRSIAVSGDTMVVGIPEFSGDGYLCGQVVTWKLSGSEWVEEEVISPQEPSFSGWFGRDVAVDGDIMAILESGKDITRVNRGSSAATHLYERTDAGWQWRRTLTNAFAHSVALEGQRLAIATTAGLYLYTLTNGNPALAGFERTFNTSAPGYEPIGRVSLDGNSVAYGLAGDISRSGGPGQVNVYERNGAGTWLQVALLRQDSPPLPLGLQQHPDGFGFALCLKDGWLAVGAPRNDAVAPQAGAVHLYERSNSIAGVTYTLRQTLTSPVNQPEAQFGSALSLSGSRLLVGAPGAGTVNPQEGRVFVYERRDAKWIGIGEVSPPIDSDGEFGWEVLATTNLWIGSGRSTGQLPRLEDRVSIVPIPDGSIVADLAVSHVVSAPVVMSGDRVVHSITISNLGPSVATQARLSFNSADSLKVESFIGQGLACTNSGSQIHCTASELPVGAVGSLEIHGQVFLPAGCGMIQSEAVATARELDTNILNNRKAISVSSELPTLAWLEPTNDAMIPFRGAVQWTAVASGEVSIASVSFYTNGALLKSLNLPPYEFLWTNAPPGQHQIGVRVINSCGVVRESEIRQVTVASNVLPFVSLLSPTAGTRFEGTNPIPIYVEASDPDGALTRVEIYRISAPLRFLQSPPYFHMWSNPPAGSHSLFAVARDNHGGATTSQLARITVGIASDSGTNWIAYNDHSGGAGTRNTVTRVDILGSLPGSYSPLRNSITGATLPVTLTISRSATVFSGETGFAPNFGSPAHTAFNGQVDFTTGSAANVGFGADSWVRYNLAGLDPNLRYTFKGTAVRGVPEFTNRWTLVELSGARSSDPTHTIGCLTGVGGMSSAQAALNAGWNLVGDVVAWTGIQPGPDGTIAITCSKYQGPVPGGSSDGESAFALTAIALEELAFPVGPPPSFAIQPASRTISPGSSSSFFASAGGATPLTYQWLKDHGVLAGARSDSLFLSEVSANDAGTYSVIVAGETGSALSDSAVLTLFSVETASSGEESVASLNIVGPVGQRYGVEFLDGFGLAADWNSLTNLTLSTNQQFIIDHDSRNQPNRFYRALPIP